MAEAGLERTLKAPWGGVGGTAEPAVNGFARKPPEGDSRANRGLPERHEQPL
jgi:hypothetical protein